MSNIVERTSCECGSSDGRMVYADGGSKCFVCEKYIHGDGVVGVLDNAEEEIRFLDPCPVALHRRRLTKETCEAWDYGVADWCGQTVQVASFRDPRNGALLFQKIRTADKNFRILGDYAPILWGQHRYRDGGKMVVLTEGEIDCLTVAQLWGSRYPVVSIPNGTKSAVKAVEAGMDWLATFEKIVVCFDNDEPGNSAAREVASILPPGKAFIASLPLKDANEMLKAGRESELRHFLWNAKEFRPDGILTGSEITEACTAQPQVLSTPLPWESLNALTRGLRTSEILTIGAGSGTGKTTFVREIIAWLLESGEKVGALFFEDTLHSTLAAMVGIHESKRIFVDDLAAMENLGTRAMDIPGFGNFTVYDYDGRIPKAADLATQIRYMAKGRGCKWVVLDHLSYLIGATDLNADERRTLDLLMTSLRSVTMETDIGLIIVSHLRRPQGRGHEEGARVSLSDFRSSGIIAQLSNTVLGLERDQQDPDNRDIVVPRVLKCRLTGKTGPCQALKYDHDTSRLSEVVEDLLPAGDDDGGEDF